MPRNSANFGIGPLGEIAGWIGFGADERGRIMAELPGRLATLGRAEAARPDPG